MVLQSELFKVTEVQISYNPKFKVSERSQIRSSNDAYRILIQQWDSGKIEFLEEFKILLLNRKSRVLRVVNISHGGVAATAVDSKVVFASALKACASSIILCHNHPSGEIDPSSEDISLTNKLKDGGVLLDLIIMDHLIISKDTFYSFADEGLI
ncbi:DNA repair protein [Pedobacter cryoconitis]|uniref:DNA repair protein n=1 Tax=Pedobacter cryoconitis TaxID=188932 RepID=A0A127VK79_9SPHI|nr:JAB domain-containing protein [Pedobacter cryoconitis]AMQ01713.1 DNA repair protein [Pedobacter cryoconitis]